MSYKGLKSGTDVRGIASDLGGKEVNLTKEAVYDITCAFVVWYVNKFSCNPADLKVAVGRDSRITGKAIADTVIKALTDSGVTVYNCGMSSTPSMFMTTVDMKTDGAIQITASHHPFDRNGLKFFIPSGGLESEDIGEIVALADNGESIISDSKGIVIPVDFMAGYSDRLKRMICEGVGKTADELPLKGLKIVVDAGNGAGGFYEKVLSDLGADTTGSQFLEPDGMFPNHIPNPEDKTAMQSICNAVLDAKADLGIIFDTDVDRAGCVGADGTEINRNRLIALSAYIACDGKKDAVIVTDSVTSDGLKTYLENDLGCKHYRYRRGYKNVINKAIELTQKGEFCPLAIETSGHAALQENYFLDDGAYLVTKIVIELAKGKKLEKITETLKTPVEEKEIRFNIKAQNFKSYGLMVIDKLNEFALSKPEYEVADDNREGIRVSTKNGWFLLRLSVHDPVMPMNFESDVVGGIEEDIAQIRDFFTQFDELDISAL